MQILLFILPLLAHMSKRTIKEGGRELSTAPG
nr:MAG TPA: hypothetical protein [Caudoviricetes sp.]